MSQWTHFLGIVRYDSIAKNMYPKPPHKDSITQTELSLIVPCFLRDIPNGSEGPLEVEGLLTKRGPTIVITGDLRDFGEPDIPKVVKWLEQSHESATEVLKAHKAMVILRDAVVWCDVEFNSAKFWISAEFDSESFKHIFQFQKIEFV